MRVSDIVGAQPGESGEYTWGGNQGTWEYTDLTSGATLSGHAALG